MSVKLLTEHHLDFPSLKGGCTGSSESYTCQNATLLEITCRGSASYSEISNQIQGPILRWGGLQITIMFLAKKKCSL